MFSISQKKYKKLSVLFLLLMLYLFFRPTNVSNNILQINWQYLAYFLSFKHVDKLIHAGLFAIWAFLLQNAYKSTVKTIFLGILLAIITELVQYHFIVSRSGDVFDAFADILGMSLGVVCYNAAKK